MWHAYNLVREGDKVTASTFRKVAKDTGTGADSEKIKLTLTVEVEGIEFDPEGEATGWQLCHGMCGMQTCRPSAGSEHMRSFYHTECLQSTLPSAQVALCA